MGRTSKKKEKGGKIVKCALCHQPFATSDKPYQSKQAGMQGAYHWLCFIESCKNRVPVSIGSFEGAPSSTSDSEEREVESAPAHVEE